MPPAQQAEVTPPARDDRTDDYPVARGDALDAFAKLGDDSSDLVAGDHARLSVFQALVDPDVGVANRGCSHSHQHLARSRRRVRHLIDADAFWFVEDKRLHTEASFICEMEGAAGGGRSVLALGGRAAAAHPVQLFHQTRLAPGSIVGVDHALACRAIEDFAGCSDRCGGGVFVADLNRLPGDAHRGSGGAPVHQVPLRPHERLAVALLRGL